MLDKLPWLMYNGLRATTKGFYMITRAQIKAKIQNDVRYTLTAEREDAIPSEYLEYTEDIESINRAVDRGELWAWCTVTVTASVSLLDYNYEGREYLGACSYDGESDFKSGGYYNEMKDRALDEMADAILETITRSEKLVNYLK